MQLPYPLLPYLRSCMSQSLGPSGLSQDAVAKGELLGNSQLLNGDGLCRPGLWTQKIQVEGSLGGDI